MKPVRYDNPVTGRFRCVFLVASLLLAAPVQSEEPDAAVPVHWALASVVGTGWYDIGDGRDAFIVNVPYRQVLRETRFEPDGERVSGLFINWEGSLGLLEIDIDPDVIDPDNFGTFSFTPGVEWEIPLSARWYLRPYASAGWGTTLGDGPSAWVYTGGVKSRYWMDSARRWALHAGAGYAGFNPDDGPAGDLFALYAGVEYGHPFSTPAGTPLVAYVQAGYHANHDSADFGLRSGDDNALQLIDDTVALGLAVGRERGFRWGFIALDRVGLTWNFEPDGDFSAVSLNLESWFHQ